MYTKKYIDSMKKCKECLVPMPEYTILAKAISILAEEADFFEKYIGKECQSCDNHFKNHLKDFLALRKQIWTPDKPLTVYSKW